MKNSDQQNSHHIKTVKVSEQHVYSGPLPEPEALAKYDQIVPGAAERILTMAEKEMQHRHKNDNLLSKSIIWTTIVSIALAFLSVVILSGLTFYALYKGYDTVAASIAVGSIAAVAGVFIFFKSAKKDK